MRRLRGSVRCQKCRDGLLDGKECKCCGGFYHDCVSCSLENSIVKKIWDMYNEQERIEKEKQDRKNSTKSK